MTLMGKTLKWRYQMPTMNEIMNKIQGKPEVSDAKTLTVRIPFGLWKRIRELQTEGKVRSINQAVVEGLKLIAK